MVVRPGFFSSNLIGKQAGAPATTPANSASGYVFSTGNTTIGSVAVTARNGNGASGPAWVDPTYDSSSNTMTFDGTAQSLGYVYGGASIHVAPAPFSLQVDFNVDRVTGHQYVVNMGQGNGLGYPEFIVDLSNASLTIQMNSSSSGSGPMAVTISNNIQVGQWYRVGAMVYITGASTVNIRCYLNSEVKVQTTLPALPYNTSTAGIAIGNDNGNFPSTFFKGKIRNFFLGKTLFWPI